MITANFGTDETRIRELEAARAFECDLLDKVTFRNSELEARNGILIGAVVCLLIALFVSMMGR